MYRKQVTETSPLRILESSIHGGLGTGNLGVVMARAGVGKTALLVRIGIDDALRDRAVLHVTLGQSLEHTVGCYDALFNDLTTRTRLQDPHAVRAGMQKNRIIQAFPDRRLTASRLRQVVELYGDSISFAPSAILIDGFDWEGTDDLDAVIAGFKTVATELDAELWMTARTHREETSDHPTELVPPCNGLEVLIDVALFLEPQGKNIAIRLLKDHDGGDVPDTNLELEPDTMRLVGEQATAPLMPPNAFTLLSGGHRGAEATFGEAAERWGVRERNFSFSGRDPDRNVSVVELTHRELAKGEVSRRYIEQHLNRSFPDTDEWRHLLDTIWHQVATAGQVFIVGTIRDDRTVEGGTGWAAELAKHFDKSVEVFDQERGRWYRWTEDGRWDESESPRITSRRFCGTGSQSLSDAGSTAIEELFARSFEKPAG